MNAAGQDERSLIMETSLVHYVEKTDLINKTEIEKVILLASYYQRNGQNDFEFTIESVCNWFETLGLHKPNKSRLKQKISKSRSFVKGKTKNSYRIHASEIQAIYKKYPFLEEPSEEILSTDTILPAPLYENTRGYIESLSKQINASYENNIFDGCAVLMRRLLEICLIHSYEHQGIDSEIKDSQGNYEVLSKIVSNALNNSKLSLSRNTKTCLEDFRAIGNYSAHKIYYNARKTDIKKVVLEYRATIEELLYKSGIRT
ncbi:hypothetical protein XM38_003390 [Halomicronema hongdechloris C2206]|uniref:DUF4145 domain-containing protein n=1 Tax=Halomicronema hongdechloris C2206 TaxID=1641165 RepID=A0A1Z3HGI6_9CYAN|nr:DUF4145 domain-containing protein [Halomicronema hongdechloris]ASC69412.1 hypothetical protein XM38_003390 [Halomicronema hongdechloris C2206]